MQQQKVVYMSRPDERLMGAPEAAYRLGMDVRKARYILRIYGMRLGNRYYITQTRLHEALADMQRRKD